MLKTSTHHKKNKGMTDGAGMQDIQVLGMLSNV